MFIYMLSSEDMLSGQRLFHKEVHNALQQMRHMLLDICVSHSRFWVSDLACWGVARRCIP